MNLSSRELADLIVEVAKEKFGNETFARRPLMLAVEQEARDMGAWTDEDDEVSKSKGIKSRGLADIDYQISNMGSRLTHVDFNQWKLPEATFDARSASTTVTRKRLKACDVGTPPQRVDSTVSRIIRDTAKTRELKQLYNYRCQVCAQTIMFDLGKFYVEVHHLRPLGNGHDGLDEKDNMLVLCPNHHAIFDFGIPKFISTTTITMDTESFS